MALDPPLATLIGACIAAAAAMTSAVVSFLSARTVRNMATLAEEEATKRNTSSQLFLREEDQRTARRAALTAPFVEALLEAANQGAVVAIAVYTLQKLPYQPAILRQLLMEGDALRRWQAAGIEVSRLRAQVIAGIDDRDVSDFLKHSNAFVQSHLVATNTLLEGPFGPSTLDSFAEPYADFRKKTSALYIEMRRIVRGAAGTTDIKFDTDALALWLAHSATTSLWFGTPTANPWWLAVWQVTEARLAKGDVFRTQLDAFKLYLETAVPGVLEVDSSTVAIDAETEKARHLMVHFADEAYLAAFKASLGAVKMQTRSLWTGAHAPEVRSSTSAG